MVYYDGVLDAPIPIGATPNRNSSVSHDLYVNFDGEKGISEFFGKGFFPNNRAISAFKKLRYDDFGAYVPGETYMAPTFTVNAYVDMGFTNGGRDYDFHWNADAKNAVIDVYEATGWTNASKASKMIDWEQTALVKGSVNLTNDLYASGLYIPGAGAEDWLPCCSDPLVYVTKSINLGDDWPNVNQAMIFNCTCPTGCAESSGLVPGYGIPGAFGVGQWYLPSPMSTGTYYA
jgi:hypothetical protein